ncbi:non-homologous end-joining DNA ligase [Jatrophihabitans sp.]|uniref:non-homologous end-joining DNA ligase n=1 Tax=Jatrophihabitans sp. TaxID=1932789 RepID=UPI0030C67F66|nr:ATP-dependent ligase LigD [Jatrophihabitans sp.]
MLATSAQVLPVGAEWAFEFKWDGVRALVDVTARGIRLASRAENDITTAYPELVTALDGSPDALLDGEVVAFVDGRPSFEALQLRMHVRSRSEALTLAASTPVSLVVFDLLRADGTDLRRRPYHERRATLEQWAADGRTGVVLSPSFDDGPATEAAARQHALEGVIAKRLGSRYEPGVRSPDWRKLRFVRSGDFVVIGWESPREGSQALSSLLLGYQVAGSLHFAGKAGSGIGAATARELQAALQGRADCVLAEQPPASPGRRVHWVEPTVVVEIAFLDWTGEGRLRHPVFQRLRTDKTVEEASGDA